MAELEEYYKEIKNRIVSGGFTAAISSIDKFLHSNPNDEIMHYYKGVCNFALERYNLAIRNYATAILLNPGFAKAYFNIGICYYMINYTDYALINIGKALFLFSRTNEEDNKTRCIEALRFIESEQHYVSS